MNLTDRVKSVTDAEDAVYRALEKNIRDLQVTQRALSEHIDARRLAERPRYPTFEHCKGIIEAVRRYKAGEQSSTQHGDPVGGEEEPYAVRYAPQGAVGWMHIAHGAPYRYVVGGGYLWRFTDEEVAFFLDYIRGEGVDPYDHWLSDGGLSVRFQDLNLDPKPWTCTSCSDRFKHEQKGLTTHVTVFKPRPQYEQERLKYVLPKKRSGIKIPKEQQ